MNNAILHIDTFLKYLTVTIILICFGIVQVNSQTWYTVVDGGSSDEDHVIDESLPYNYHQYIYLQSAIGTDGDISEIQLEHNSSCCQVNNVRIYMGHTSKSAFTSNVDWITSGLVLVYSGSVTPASGWYTITLDNTFYYNNSDNLVILFDNDAGSACGTTSYMHYYIGPGYNSMMRYEGSNNYPAAPPDDGDNEYDNELASLKLYIGTGSEDDAGSKTDASDSEVSAYDLTPRINYGYAECEFAGNIWDAGDVADWYRIDNNVHDKVWVELSVPANDDYNLVITDDDGAVRGSSDAGGNGVTESIEITDFSWTGAGDGSEHLHIKVVPDQPGTDYDNANKYILKIKIKACTYYVNDNSTSGDTWCSAVGSDANSGIRTTGPKATITSVIADYALEGGDYIYVDKGTYTLEDGVTENIITTDDDGAGGSYVTFQGADSTKTIIDCNNDADWEFLLAKT
ncbi:MAG: hypothetical protein KJ607_00395, partial [Bacteroidetes bacterium]|nr:hypothetical protein [Bacteroidota bacterium]